MVEKDAYAVVSTQTVKLQQRENFDIPHLSNYCVFLTIQHSVF
jgi:hypothetical protein